MAYASDRLRERRMKMNQKDDAGGGEEYEEAQKPSNREVMLTDEEKKSIGGAYQPGEEVQCEVHGRLSGDGKLQIVSIAPLGGNQEMPQEQTMRTNPMMMPG